RGVLVVWNRIELGRGTDSLHANRRLSPPSPPFSDEAEDSLELLGTLDFVGSIDCLGFGPQVLDQPDEMGAAQAIEPPETADGECRQQVAHPSIVVIMRVGQAEELQLGHTLLLEELEGRVLLRVVARARAAIDDSPAAVGQSKNDALAPICAQDVDFETSWFSSHRPDCSRRGLARSPPESAAASQARLPGVESPARRIGQNRPRRSRSERTDRAHPPL